jgi:hypothetical protein
MNLFMSLCYVIVKRYVLSSKFGIQVTRVLFSSCMSHIKNIPLDSIILNCPSTLLSMLIKNHNNNKILKGVFHNIVQKIDNGNILH